MQPIRLRLPATSANLGPGFDAVGLALDLNLVIDARLGTHASASQITATGRNADFCARTSPNLILDTYTDVLSTLQQPAPPLELTLQNGIPLGMGCGSSAAALLGGVLLANHFGNLGWTLHRSMEEASRREGHPDNVAACAFGWMTISCAAGEGATPERVVTATCGQDLPWTLLLALPSAALATEKARALLPGSYSRADAVANLQRVALLIAAFSQGRGDLLHTAMGDHMHQPFRMDACPLLLRLLPLSGTGGILGVALSGAGPGVLAIAKPGTDVPNQVARIRKAAADPGLEIVATRAARGVKLEELTES